MAISPVSIGRMALSNIGDKSNIESLDEQSTAARKISIWYDHARKQALEAFDWSFARKRQTLATHGDDPTTEWVYRYQLPSDCVAFRRIFNPLGEDAEPIPFDLEISTNGTLSILTNQADAIGVYTFDQTACDLFSPIFVTALSYLIAFYICYDVTGKQDVKKGALETYISLIRNAQTQNANQKQKGPPREASWIAAR